MNKEISDKLENVAKKLSTQYEEQEILDVSYSDRLPNRQIVYSLIEIYYGVYFCLLIKKKL